MTYLKATYCPRQTPLPAISIFSGEFPSCPCFPFCRAPSAPPLTGRTISCADLEGAPLHGAPHRATGTPPHSPEHRHTIIAPPPNCRFGEPLCQAPLFHLSVLPCNPNTPMCAGSHHSAPIPPRQLPLLAHHRSPVSAALRFAIVAGCELVCKTFLGSRVVTLGCSLCACAFHSVAGASPPPASCRVLYACPAARCRALWPHVMGRLAARGHARPSHPTPCAWPVWSLLTGPRQAGSVVGCAFKVPSNSILLQNS
jgi:hypothetical protein